MNTLLNKISGVCYNDADSIIKQLKQNSEEFHIGNIEQRLIDATSEFNVSVDASCFFAQFDCSPSFTCRVFDLYTNSYIREYGWVNRSFVSDTKLYSAVSKYDRNSSYVWRSGIKHDCASVLELTFSDGKYINGLGEIVNIENDLIYPLLKSSDIYNYEDNIFRKFIIVPQRKTGYDTSVLKKSHPLAYSYLSKHGRGYNIKSQYAHKESPVSEVIIFRVDL